MAHVSVVRKLERCERLGRPRQSMEASTTIHADTLHLIKYKVRIKDYSSTSLHNPPAGSKLLHVLQSKPPSSPSLPTSTDLQFTSLQNLHDQQVQSFLSPPLELSHLTLHENDRDASCTSWSLCKLQPSEIEFELPHTLSSAATQPQAVSKGEDNSSSECELQTNAKKETWQALGKEKSGAVRTASPWQLQSEEQEKRPAGKGFWEAVKKMECECCSMEEECTEGYEERVRGRLRGHWLCGLCEEAVGEEKKRVGGSMQAALVAHMQPCKRFSGRARSRVSPPSAEVAVPRAVCRLLSRRLSTPSPHQPPSPTALCRSTSCISSLPPQID